MQKRVLSLLVDNTAGVTTGYLVCSAAEDIILTVLQAV